MKLMIGIGITVGGILGGYVGSLLDGGGSIIGVWSLLLSTIGSFAGIWAGYRAAQYYGF